MISLTNRLICYIAKHKTNRQVSGFNPFTGEDFVFCTRCRALLPVYKLD